MTPSKQSRREFLKRAAALGSLGSVAPFALNLAGIGAASAQSAPNYRALVCLFMFGGNDHNNTVVPFDTTSYNAYRDARSGLEIPYANLMEIVPATSSQGVGRRFALPVDYTPAGSTTNYPYMKPMQSLFAQGKAAVLANVGPLLRPTTLADYKANRQLPPKLFSHNDQTTTWQAFTSEGARVGWGGKMGDLLASSNSKTTFTAISASGNAVFLSGQNVLQYQVGVGNATTAGGAERVNGLNGTSLFGSAIGDEALRTLLTQAASPHLFELDHASVMNRSIAASGDITTAMSASSVSTAPYTLPANLTNSRLAWQLRTVAQLIAARGTLGANRQVFFVSLGGFDTHDNELANHPRLMTEVSSAIEYFYNATVALGVANETTLFTASDFGRTLTSNGDGSDHAWGAHHFVVGGAVKGGDIYGNFQEVALKTTEDVGSGRYIPSTSVDQYAATLARWFGVQASDLPLVAPNIGNFSTQQLGFL